MLLRGKRFQFLLRGVKFRTIVNLSKLCFKDERDETCLLRKKESLLLLQENRASITPLTHVNQPISFQNFAQSTKFEYNLYKCSIPKKTVAAHYTSLHSLPSFLFISSAENK